jgi:hypothetical protein
VHFLRSTNWIIFHPYEDKSADEWTVLKCFLQRLNGVLRPELVSLKVRTTAEFSFEHGNEAPGLIKCCEVLPCCTTQDPSIRAQIHADCYFDGSRFLNIWRNYNLIHGYMTQKGTRADARSAVFKLQSINYTDHTRKTLYKFAPNLSGENPTSAKPPLSWQKQRGRFYSEAH